MNKAIFLDRDGTINIDKAYLSKIEDFEYIPNAVEGLKILQNNGFLLIVITNQSGIARGYYKEEDFNVLNMWMVNDLLNRGVIIHKVLYCPHHPYGKIKRYAVECNCRKPGVELYEKAIEEFDIDLSKSYAIGDKIRDTSLCISTECRGFLISDLERPDIIDDVTNGMYRNVKYARNLYDAAVSIIGGEK